MPKVETSLEVLYKLLVVVFSLTMDDHHCRQPPPDPGDRPGSLISLLISPAVTMTAGLGERDEILIARRYQADTT